MFQHRAGVGGHIWPNPPAAIWSNKKVMLSFFLLIVNLLKHGTSSDHLTGLHVAPHSRFSVISSFSLGCKLHNLFFICKNKYLLFYSVLFTIVEFPLTPMGCSLPRLCTLDTRLGTRGFKITFNNLPHPIKSLKHSFRILSNHLPVGTLKCSSLITPFQPGGCHLIPSDCTWCNIMTPDA